MLRPQAAAPSLCPAYNDSGHFTIVVLILISLLMGKRLCEHRCIVNLIDSEALPAPMALVVYGLI